MKKIFILMFGILLLTCSCGKFDINQAKNEFKDKVTSSKGYELKATMEIYNNEDTFKYDIVVNYKKDDFYKVSMVNQNNNHEQIILKNEDAVYVVTPSLNKSFKFESEWPENSSQSYILSSLLNDTLNDSNATLEEKSGQYVITTSVNYPHNKALENQKLYFSKDMDLKTVEVYDNNGNKKINVMINDIDYKVRYKDNYFDLNTLIDENIEKDEDKEDSTKSNTTKENTSTSEQNSNTTENAQNSTTKENTENNSSSSTNSTNQNNVQTSELDEILYPLYVPANTYLKSTDKVNNSDRTILTFNGDSSFILVEEAATVSKEFEIIPVSGDPLLIFSSIGALSDNSLSWFENNKEYYLTSSNLSTDELMTIAGSLGSTYGGK